MKAVVCTKYGAPEVLKLTEVEKPIPQYNEVLVKIYTTSVTVADSRVRGFRVPPSFWFPARIALGMKKPRKSVLGTDFAGEVESVGKDVTLFKKGDWVFGNTGVNLFGAYAEYISIPENSAIALKPESITNEEAASIPFGAVTALYFLNKAKLQKGQKVLIYGASGAVGTAAVQLAKNIGATVTGVCSGANVKLVKSLGADNVIDYTKQDITKSSETYDVIFDTVGKSAFSWCMQSLKQDGIYLQTLALPPLLFKMKWTALTSGKKLYGGTAFPKKDNLEFLKKLIETRKFKPVIDRTYPLEKIVDAHRYVDAGHKKGNVVIVIRHDK